MSNCFRAIVEKNEGSAGDGLTVNQDRSVAMYSVSQKIPPEDFWQFFKNGWEFINQILRAYYVFLSTLDYEFLFNYLQL